MLWIDPDNVTLGDAPLPGVSAITIDRRAERAITEWTDFGPHPTFADVPEQRIAIRIVRTIAPGETVTIRPGDALALAFRVGASLGASGAKTITASVVIVGVTHAADPKRGMAQTIECIALSSTGAADPIIETPVT